MEPKDLNWGLKFTLGFSTFLGKLGRGTLTKIGEDLGNKHIFNGGKTPEY